MSALRISASEVCQQHVLFGAHERVERPRTLAATVAPNQIVDLPDVSRSEDLRRLSSLRGRVLGFDNGFGMSSPSF